MLILEQILEEISNVNKPQKKFIKVVITTLMLFRGQANYRNMSRYSDINEKTYSRWYRRTFDFGLLCV